MHYDREGRPLDLWAWASLLEDPAQRHVRKSRIGPFRVSTIWLGIDHSFGCPGPPLIFETMIFGPEDHPLTDWCTRAPTEEVALSVHREAIALAAARSGLSPEDATDEPDLDVSCFMVPDDSEPGPDAMRWRP